MVSICGTHDPGSMRSLQSIRAGGIGRFAFAITLAAYLFLFSWAALVHAYAQDELVDAHGCLIGVWVQHANATDGAAHPLAPLFCLGELIQPSSDVAFPKTVLSLTSRGPPSHSS
jgi:hypothetical protein